MSKDTKAEQKKIRQISYLGSADAKPDDSLYKEALACSKYLTQEGFVAINGGGPGVMRAVSEGAKEAKGTAVGVTFYPKDITNYEGRDPDNPIDIEVKTGNYLERTLKLLELGDAFVIFNGGTGTISEFGMAWGLARLYFGYHKPLILYGDFWNKVLKSFVDNMILRPEEREVYRIVNSPQEAHQAILLFEEILKSRKEVHPSEKAFQL